MPKTITITGNSIPIPKTLAQKWRGSRVVISDRGIEILPKQGLMTEWRKLKPLAGTFTQKQIARVIAEVRAEQRSVDDSTNRS